MLWLWATVYISEKETGKHRMCVWGPSKGVHYIVQIRGEGNPLEEDRKQPLATVPLKENWLANALNKNILNVNLPKEVYRSFICCEKSSLELPILSIWGLYLEDWRKGGWKVGWKVGFLSRFSWAMAEKELFHHWWKQLFMPRGIWCRLSMCFVHWCNRPLWKGGSAATNVRVQMFKNGPNGGYVMKRKVTFQLKRHLFSVHTIS